MYEQVHHKQQTAQMATLTAHRERERWEHEGGPPPLHSHYGQVRCLPPHIPLSLLHHLVGMIASLGVTSAMTCPLPMPSQLAFNCIDRNA